MAKKKDNTLIYIGAAAILYFLFMKKNKNVTQKRANIKADIQNEDMQPIIDKNDYFKQQYQESLNACSY